MDHATGGTKNVCSALWHACAGPLVSLPSEGSRVVYFPQGHLAQVAGSMNEGEAQQMPTPNLPPQIFCHLLSLKLHAEQETDEVYAQLTLVPDFEQSDCPSSLLDLEVQSFGKYMFCKTLTASDTSTHGGFSVPRRAAEDCLPPLDYSVNRPSQEIVARDIHGAQWHFRHIYRGQPRRHLLTTGWSFFLNHKRLVAGDAVLFLRDMNGELKVGIRRVIRQQSSAPMSVLPSQSMRMGILAAAAHAVSTKGLFSVFYNPRTSPAEFVISYHKYKKSLSHTLSVGMRFKTKFESHDLTERRCVGTIVGIGDLESVRWPKSKWQCLKVTWDEHESSEQQERLSPWYIEPFIAGSAIDDFPQSFKLKRDRAGLENLDAGTPMGNGDYSLRQRVLQGQENRLPSSSSSLRDGDFRGFIKRQGRELNKYIVGDVDQGKMKETRRESSLPYANSHFSSVFDASTSSQIDTTFGRSTSKVSHLGGGITLVPNKLWQKPVVIPKQERENVHFTSPVQCSLLSQLNPNPLSGLKSTNMGISTQSLNGQDHLRSNCSLLSSTTNSDAGKPHERMRDSMANPMASYLLKNFPHYTSSDFSMKPFTHSSLSFSSHASGSSTAEGMWKIFGYSLEDKTTAVNNTTTIPDKESRESMPNGELTGESDVMLRHSREPKNVIEQTASRRLLINEKLDLMQGSVPRSGIKNSSRKRVKVQKKGIIVGRTVDISKFNGYTELINALEKLFNMEGELSDTEMGWQVVYKDDEGDMMLVGDDPWQEFCGMVGKILILTREELQAMSPPVLAAEAQSCSLQDHPPIMESPKFPSHQKPNSSSSPIKRN